MNDRIFKCNPVNFPINDISLAIPQGLQGGAYISKIIYNNNNPLRIQTPTCFTKRGLIETDKKIYCDLLFDIDDSQLSLFFNNIQTKIKELIYEHRDIWFDSDMDMDTIEYHWRDMFRVFKKTKHAIRAYVHKPKPSDIQITDLMIYNETEQLVGMEHITNNTPIIALLQLHSLKFTKHCFSLEFYLKQILVVNTNNSTRLIKTNSNSTITSDPADESGRGVELPPDCITDENNNSSNQVVQKNSNTPLYNCDKTIALEEIPLNALEYLEKKKVTSQIVMPNSTTDSVPIRLTDPREVYMKLYLLLKSNTKKAKTQYINSYLEAKQIKTLYGLDDDTVCSDDELLNNIYK
jgi:hypothetical protein